MVIRNGIYTFLRLKNPSTDATNDEFHILFGESAFRLFRAVGNSC